MSPALYFRWLRLARDIDVDAMLVSADLILDGYPRSGNTYCSIVLNELYPQASIVTHLHSIAILKASVRNSIPAIALIRDPEQAIPSSIAKRIYGQGMSLSDALRIEVDAYVSYYSYVSRNTNLLCVLRMEDVVRDPQVLIDSLVRRFGWAQPPCNTTVAAKRAYERLSTDQRIGGDRNLSDKQKVEIKDQIRQMVDLQSATACYQRVLSCIA
jgi:hypothetical protein